MAGSNDKWDKNKKSPKDPISDGKIKPKQGWWHGEADALGSHDLRYVNPNKKDEYIHQKLSAHGSFKVQSYDDKEKGFHVGLNVGGVRKYNTASVSHQTDGQMQSDIEKCELTQTGGDGGIVHKGDHYNGVGGNRIHGEGGSKLRFTQGGSSVVNYNVVNGKTGNMYEDHHHSSYAKDRVVMMKGGNHLTISQKGDIGIDIQKGNWDTNVSSKARINTGGSMLYSSGDTFTGTSKKAMAFTSKDTFDASSSKSMALSTDTSLRTKSKQGTTFEAGEDFMISSDSKITLKVGGSSIEISSGSIKIKSGGEVNIQGSSTKIQGGGVTTWQLPGTPLGPATFT